MIARILLMVAVVGFAMAVVFKSPIAAVAAVVLGVFSVAAKGIDL